MRFDHECPEWDYMRIDESCDEFQCCTCYDDPDARIFRDMHSRYHDQIMRAYRITEKKDRQ